jgi:integrase
MNELMQITLGQNLHVQSTEAYSQEWLKGKKASGTSSGTLGRYEPVLLGFLESLPEKRRKASMASITPLEIERFRNAEVETGKTAGIANFGIKVLRAVFNTARRHGLIPNNPAEAVELLPESSEERTPFSQDQVKALLSVANVQWQGMILLGYHSGIRLADAANLTEEFGSNKPGSGVPPA